MPDNHPNPATPPLAMLETKQRSPSPELGGPVSVYEMAKWHHSKRVSQATCAIDRWRIRTSSTPFPFPPPLQSARRERELDGCGPVVLVFEVRRRGAPSGGPLSWLELRSSALRTYFPLSVRQPPSLPLHGILSFLLLAGFYIFAAFGARFCLLCPAALSGSAA